ncbi:hypothetical protein KMW28_05355 [Flammeovirga yaeyamensis]|uniref:DUF748 domain-containing protein n=1 Tax=Flammeovirga yaeyamensis TaxID=367791 RepID=A0AAX1NBH9_9BACT|nr:hypothetical protein [Flammeovirga yaeyamensis]MBB3697591.1 hypothetical protein [Flammeovirga yaeyamensis]NMF36281.1 hypothetical protein [Flammeovirga yaeyamensis]QWG03008.1 hypothetical protein KMW28_05355 [Flammeovirga yaeyamensis]
MASKRKLYIRLLLLIGIPILGYFGVQYANHQLEDFAMNAIKEVAIGKKGDGYYVNFQYFKIHWEKSKLEATGITILPNVDSENENWVNATVDTLDIEFSHLYSGLLLGNIQVKEFSLIRPNLQYFYREKKKDDDKPSTKDHHSPIPKFDILGQRLNKVGISSINIKEVTFNGYLVTKENKHQHIFHTTQNLRLNGIDFHLEETDENLIDIDEVVYNCGPTFMKAYGGLYEYKFDSLWVSNEASAFSIQKFELKPQTSSEVFFKRVGKQTDMMSVVLDSLSGNGFSPNSLFKHNVINLDELILDGAKITIYRDKNYEEDTTVVKALPHHLLRTSEYDIKLDRFALNHSQLIYKEKSKNAKQPGILKIDDLQLYINNINTELEKDIHMDLQCRLFGSKKAKMTFDLLTDSASEHFLTGEGHIPAFSLYHLNAFTHPNMGVMFQKGEVIDINFNVKMNDKIGRGNLDFYYKDLKLKLTGKNDSKSNFVESLTGFAANSLVYHKNLPGNRGRHAPLYFVRVEYKSVVHFIIHTILSGAETAVIGTYGQLPPDERKAYKHGQKHHKSTK